MSKKREPTIGALLRKLESQEFTPEKFMQLKRQISTADERKNKCSRCRKKNAIVGCLLCCECAIETLHASLSPSTAK